MISHLLDRINISNDEIESMLTALSKIDDQMIENDTVCYNLLNLYFRMMLKVNGLVL